MKKKELPVEIYELSILYRCPTTNRLRRYKYTYSDLRVWCDEPGGEYGNSASVTIKCGCGKEHIADLDMFYGAPKVV